MNAWDFLKESVKARQELERIKKKFFGRPADWHDVICPNAELDLNESIQLMNKVINELTKNLTR